MVSNEDNSKEDETLAESIIALWDAASEYRQSESAHAAMALRAALNAVSAAIDAVAEAPALHSNAEMMIRCELDVDRLIAVRERAENHDAVAALNVRVPEFLNAYVRRFQSRANDRRKRNRQSELTLQQIVTEALALFLAVHALPDPLPEPEW